MPQKTVRAKQLRKTQTKSEGLLWSILRARQLCGLKFRRQHPIGPFIADFACIAKRLVVEIDGGYHDLIGESDLSRQALLKQEGWDVLRFTDEDVEQDSEAVAQAIATYLGLQYELKQRMGTGSGMESVHAPGKAGQSLPSPVVPSPVATASDPPKGG